MKSGALILLTAAAAFSSWYWGLVALQWPLSVLFTPETSDAAMIERTIHGLIVPPSLLGLEASTSGAGINQWLFWETVARLGIIWGLWAAFLALYRVSGRQRIGGPASA